MKGDLSYASSGSTEVTSMGIDGKYGHKSMGALNKHDIFIALEVMERRSMLCYERLNRSQFPHSIPT